MADQLCPDCGGWFDRLEADTGWCRSCTGRWRKARRRLDESPEGVWVSCKYCWTRFRSKSKFVIEKSLSYATCRRCLSEQRRRACLGIPPLVARVKCQECRVVFTPKNSWYSTRYCDACRVIVRSRKGVIAGKRSALVAPRSRRSDGKFGAPDAPPIQVPRDSTTGRFIRGS